jgi:hypothetical protein
MSLNDTAVTAFPHCRSILNRRRQSRARFGDFYQQSEHQPVAKPSKIRVFPADDILFLNTRNITACLSGKIHQIFVASAK